MDQSKFNEDEIPYNILANFGLTQEMIEDLPESTYKKMKRGLPTPVLPIRVKAESGDTITSRSKFALVRKGDGAVGVIFYPKLVTTDLSRFTDQQQAALKSGESIVADSKSDDGSSTPTYYQIDPDTNHVLSVPVAVLAANIQLLAEHMRLSKTEAACIRNGKPLTIMDGNKPFTMGVDLSSSNGIKAIDGDDTDFRNSVKRDWGQYNFGLNGCWTMDGDGNTAYVPEDEYTEEMWSEMKRRGNQHQMKL